MKGASITGTIRGDSPCKDCKEKSLGCHSRCPKDERGERGYKAFRAEVERVNASRYEYQKKKMR